MSEDLCLSRDEIRQLTRTPVKARQLAFLRQNGIRHYIDLNGWPVVVRSAVGARPTGDEKKAAPWVSNKWRQYCKERGIPL